MNKKIIIGTRKSKLALTQSEWVAEKLRSIHKNIDVELLYIITKGDRDQTSPLPAIGGKGLFTAELEEALRNKEIDLAVHSLKDLPTELQPEFTLGAIPVRESPFDAFISAKYSTLESIPTNGIVGTSSVRRTAIIQNIRPDISVVPIRGNVDTRLKKACEGDFDGIILAEAGLSRLGLTAHIRHRFSPDQMLPAPGQGALGIQCRSGDNEIINILQPLDCKDTRTAVSIERDFLRHLEAGCSTPVAAYATIINNTVNFIGRCYPIDGSKIFEVTSTRSLNNISSLGADMANQAINLGFQMNRI